MHRLVFALLVALAAAGCVTAPGAEVPQGNDTAPTGATPTATPPTGEADGGMQMPDGPMTMRLHFAKGHKLVPAAPGAEGDEPETVAPYGFFASTAQPLELGFWAADAADHAMQLEGALDWTVRLRAGSPAQETTPRAAGFPPVGGWVGTDERWAGLKFMSDAPAQLEAGKTYELKGTVELPPGGFFLAPGETFGLRTFLSYQTADQSPVNYVVGGDSPAGVAFTMRRVALPPTTEVAVASEEGELQPYPNFGTTGGNPSAKTFDIELPPGTVWARFELVATPKGPDNLDVDLHVQKGGKDVGAGTGPTAHEVVVLGPANLAASGLQLEAFVSGANTSGATYTLTVTAHVASAAAAPVTG